MSVSGQISASEVRRADDRNEAANSRVSDVSIVSFKGSERRSS